MRLIDFSDCKIDRHTDYAGSDRKNAIIYDGDRYMIKFSERQEPKNDYATSCVNNVLSEYIGSHIASLAGIPTHETLLGTYNGELVVACKNFLKPGETLHEFSWYLRNQYDSSDIKRTPVLSQIYDTINNHPDLSQIRQIAIDRYWDTFVVDALIGNFDRHAGNWGYIVGVDDAIRPSPIYDCGSCLYSGLSTDQMEKVTSTELSIAKRLFSYPKAALFVGELDAKVGYYDMLSSGYDKACSKAVLRIVPRIDMNDVISIIEQTPCLSKERRQFYETMLEHRYELILERAYMRVSEDRYDDVALDRIGTVSFKEEVDAWNEYLRAKEEVDMIPYNDDLVSYEEEDINVDNEDCDDADSDDYGSID